MSETPGYVVLKNSKNGSLFPAVVPEGVDEQEVIDTYKAHTDFKARGPKGELPELLNQPTSEPAEPVASTTTTKEK